MKTWQRIHQNPKLLAKYLVREQVVDGIRLFFKNKGFREVQTPLLVPVPSSEPNLEVLETELKTAKGVTRRAFLTMSPEHAIKKLLAAGIGNCFEITRAFRNGEEVGPQHNMEFTILEWYRVEADYTAVMKDFGELFCSLVATVQPKADLTRWQYQNQFYDLTTPWKRMSVAEAFEVYAQIDLETLLDEKGLKQKAKEKGYRVSNTDTWEQNFYQIFLNEIDPQLIKLKQPVIVYDYPLSQAALARRKPSDPRLAERFEVFVAGVELGNCFSELTDPKEQLARFKHDLSERQRLKKTGYRLDEDLIRALETGLPETAGIAVGVDRLIMLLADVATVAETLFFPGKELFDLV